MPAKKPPWAEPPSRWMSAEIEAPLDVNRDAAVLRRVLGVANLHDDHPVRQLWASARAESRFALHHLADDLRLVEGTDEFGGLVKRLRTDLQAYDDMRYELRLAAILKRGGQSLAGLGGSKAGPDVEFISQSGHRCAVACYRLRSGTDTIQLLRDACKQLAESFFRVFLFHPMPGDWLLDVIFPRVPLRAGERGTADDLLDQAWRVCGPDEREHQGVSVSKQPLPNLRRLPGQKRRAQARFFFPVRHAEIVRAGAQVWDKVEKERAWASTYNGVPVLAIEESDSLLGGGLKGDLAATLAVENNPFAGVLLTSARTIEDAEWVPGSRAPDTLHLNLATFGPNVRTWAHGHHLVQYAPDHAVEQWSFFDTTAGAGSELVRSLTYGVHCCRVVSPPDGVQPDDDPEFQQRLDDALDRIRREDNRLAESTGVVGFLNDQ